jgi:hypothetical protein
MQPPLGNTTAGPLFALAVLASLVQFILIIVAVLALRRMAAAQEATARHLEQLLEVAARTGRSVDI